MGRRISERMARSINTSIHSKCVQIQVKTVIQANGERHMYNKVQRPKRSAFNKLYLNKSHTQMYCNDYVTT